MQSIFATVAILFIMSILDISHQTAIIASMGATCFILFAMPRTDNAKPRRVVGGYAMGITSGILCSYLPSQEFFTYLLYTRRGAIILAAAIAVGVAIFLMVILDMEHPPAAGMAMAILFNPWKWGTILIVFTAIVLLTLISYGLRPIMKNLL